VIEKIKTQLQKFRIKVDDRTEVTPGFKFNDWEMRGVPLRLEVGPKDVEKGSVMAARRDIPGREGKSFLSQDDLETSVGSLLSALHTSLYEKAKAFRDSHIFDPKDYEELKKVCRKMVGRSHGGAVILPARPR
jgi:prolyl-tRNA synthetase